MSRETGRFSSFPIADFMTSRVLCLSPSISLKEAARRVADSNANYLVIMEGGTPLGVLGEGDLLRLVLTNSEDCERKLGLASAGELLQCSLSSSGTEVQKLLEGYCGARIVVLDGNGEVAGVVGETELHAFRASHSLSGEALLWRTALESTRDGVIFQEAPSGKVIDANQAFASMLGYSREEIIGMHPWDWDASFSREEIVKMAHEHRAGEVIFETRMRRKDGTLLDVEVSATSTEFEDAVHIFCICRDISARKETELALREREELYSAIVNQAPDGVVLVDAETLRFQEFNEVACQGLGYSRQEFASLSVPDINTEFTREDHVRKTGKILEQGHAVFETQHLHRDGSKRNVRVSLRVVQLRGRHYFVGFWTDITRQCEMEKALRESHQRLDEMFSFLPDATFAIDPQGRVIAWNRAMEKLTGIRAEQIMGRGNREYAVALYGERRPLLVDLVLSGSEGAEQWYASLEREGNKLTADSLCISGPDGEDVYFSGVAAPMFDSNGKLIGAIEQIRDTTGMRLAEIEQKRLEEQLRQATKMEAVGQLAGGIAHDFNNIMTAIVGFGHILELKLGKDSPLNSYLNKIFLASERAASLTRDLLTFSRKQVVQLRPIDFGEAVAKTHKLLTRLIRADIELSVSSSGNRLTVMADDSQLTQILMNLTTNARDALPKGGRISITTSAFVMDQEYVTRHGYGRAGSYALITFADSGCGMDEKTRERIFEPFFTTKEVGKGTGLGLATVYGIVKQLEGYINVYSEPEKGTVFRIYLPLIQSAAPAEELEETAGRMPGGNETILLAEDDPDVREIVESLLAEAGYSVISARDGAEASRIFAESGESIDLLVLDAIMPGKNGVEVYRQALELRPQVKAIMMSGYTSEIMVVNGLIERGMKFMQKPVNPREFMQAVREILDRRAIMKEQQV